MCVHDVERVVGERQRVDVGDLERDVDDAAFVRLGVRGVDRRDGRVDSDDPAGSHPRREIERDVAGTAADVEEVEAGPQRREQVRGRILRGAPAVRAQHALVMAVRVSAGRDFVHDRLS